MQTVADTISMSFMAAGVIPAALWIQTADDYYLHLILGVLLTNLVVAAIKEVVGAHGVFARPAEATGCDAFCMNGSVGGRPGFPSGHMTTATMLVICLWWHTESPVVLWIGVPWIAAMAWARWQKRCHNGVQIAGGVVFGYLSASAFQILSRIGN
jgi:membrane-associated phospholipid phosphatase